MRLILFLLIILQSNLLIAKNNSVEKELYYDDSQFISKYIKKLTSIKELEKILHTSNDITLKIATIIRLCDFLDNDRAFQLVLNSVHQYRVSEFQHDIYWKIRTSAIYNLGKKSVKLSANKKIQIQSLAILLFKQDKNFFVIGASAHTMVRIATNINPNANVHRFFKKRTIANLFSERLLELKEYENDLCIILTKACIRLKDPQTYLALIEVRKKRFHPKVLVIVQNAIYYLKGL